VSCDIRVIEPGKVSPIAHGEDFGQKTVKGAHAYFPLHYVTIKDHLVAHLVAELAMALLANNLGEDGEPVIPAFLFFGHVSLLYILLWVQFQWNSCDFVPSFVAQFGV
jgi:hypothetical protein